jgi:riboflavin synthase
MFSGIIEGMGTVVSIIKDQENVHFTLGCDFTHELKVDQSLSHNGVCLTVVSKEGSNYTVTAIKETLIKTNLGKLKIGDKVNLERSMKMDGRLDGHIVQGHVDQTAQCKEVVEADGSWYYTFAYDFDQGKAKQGYMTVEKGSVTVNGVSLTVVNSQKDSFQVAIIPYTYEHTNFHTFHEGSIINLEFDIIGKYLSRLAEFSK